MDASKQWGSQLFIICIMCPQDQRTVGRLNALDRLPVFSLQSSSVFKPKRTNLSVLHSLEVHTLFCRLSLSSVWTSSALGRRLHQLRDLKSAFRLSLLLIYVCQTVVDQSSTPFLNVMFSHSRVFTHPLLGFKLKYNFQTFSELTVLLIDNKPLGDYLVNFWHFWLSRLFLWTPSNVLEQEQFPTCCHFSFTALSDTSTHSLFVIVHLLM